MEILIFKTHFFKFEISKGAVIRSGMVQSDMWNKQVMLYWYKGINIWWWIKRLFNRLAVGEWPGNRPGWIPSVWFAIRKGESV